ncbi:hypothetical protein E4K65_16615 [Bradyrhizobium niftali]|uniref:Uncharacterized protein n=1 Tax=Bradyrhizobium niftali TaxID=2560055 RepID=A0A4Y9LWP8_9BRAD|nr:hypothetical protein E4K65_16615 [Bradyrhizobium niftali]
MQRDGAGGREAVAIGARYPAASSPAVIPRDPATPGLRSRGAEASAQAAGGRRGIQYAAASRLYHSPLGVLDRPVKPGDDTFDVGRAYPPPHPWQHASFAACGSYWSRRRTQSIG